MRANKSAESGTVTRKRKKAPRFQVESATPQSKKTWLMRSRGSREKTKIASERLMKPAKKGQFGNLPLDIILWLIVLGVVVWFVYIYISKAGVNIPGDGILKAP